MKSFLSRYGGVNWVVNAYDDWVFGPRPSRDPDGGWECPGSIIDETVLSLPEILAPDGKRIRIVDPSIRDIPKNDPSFCRVSRTTHLYEIWSRLVVDGVPSKKKILIGKFPKMVGSMTKEIYDAGFFIIDGGERAFVNKESKRFDAKRFYETDGKVHCVDINSLDSPFTMKLNEKTKSLTIEMGFSPNKRKLDFFEIVRALGEKRTIEEMWAGEHLDVVHLLTVCSKDLDASVASERVGEAFSGSLKGKSAKRLRFDAQSVVSSVLLPFLGPDSEKQEYLRRVAIELAQFCLGLIGSTDVDAMENKRIDTAGKIVARLVRLGLRKSWSKTSDSLSRMTHKSGFVDYERYIIKDAVEKICSAAMKTGALTAQIVPRRANWWESIATCRRVTANVSASGYVVGPRLFHGTSYGFYCACETQEGERTGLSRETAMFFKVSPRFDSRKLREEITKADLPPGDTDIFVDSSLVRSSVDYHQSMEICRLLKRKIAKYAGLRRETKDLFFDTSEGRAIRPVWIIPSTIDDDGDFDELVSQGKIEWVDALQVKTIYIATGKQRIEKFHTHVELHPTSVLGPSAANIPFLDRNPGSRNLFGSHVRHQAVGDPYPFAKLTKMRNNHNRFDTDESHRMWYPQRALCDTIPGRLMKSNDHPCGWNPVVFVLAKPKGQEDSMGISRRQLDFGAATSESEVSLLFRVDLETEMFGNAGNYPKIDTDGTPRVGETFMPDEIVVSKQTKDGRDANGWKWPKHFPGTVRAVARDDQGKISVRFAWTRRPNIGDKFATRHGQKGVMNFVIEDEDTYWTKDGLTPDLILSPAAFPTRMTIGNLFETLCGKLTSIRPPDGYTTTGCGGSIADCTPYSDTFDYKAVQEAMRSHGYQPKGHETVYSAKTGLPLEAQVFIGPTFVQRLTHFSFTKCYARGRGSKNPQTGQPPKGRSNDGGLKLGEMETKAQQAYGAASALQTAFLECSDGVEVSICISCKDMRLFTLDGRCMKCGNMEKTDKIVPRAFLLLRDELKVSRIKAELSV